MTQYLLELVLLLEKKMKKLKPNLILLFCLFVFTIFGCGEDEDTTEKPIVEPSVTDPAVNKEKLIGTWNIITINDKPPLYFIEEDEPDEEDRVKIKVETLSYSFTEDDTWTMNIEAEMHDFPEVQDIEGSITIAGMLTGTYTLTATQLTLKTENTDIDISAMPVDFIESALEGDKESVFQELLMEFNANIFTPFKKSNYTIKENSMELNSTYTSLPVMKLKKAVDPQ